MTNDWPELTKLLTADIRELRAGAPDVMKAFSSLALAAGRGEGARRQDQGADRARHLRRCALRRLHRFPCESRRRSRREPRGGAGDARHVRLHGRRSVSHVCKPCATSLHAVRDGEGGLKRNTRKGGSKCRLADYLSA